ncbi:DUF3017 domain-containing protein [Nakamurella leprariae]|uniref:DUF3017 domain-containing protein n=1 Tax=Nakamurella leprariae TaxID=2803911 RepID=A0A938YH06_9ACTN|nr:DUF3017 domain-containing protein [Nakamurella leprariae]MBM9467645.1 DUF3017 domain-containing protein [Nakamurella leprariae]
MTGGDHGGPAGPLSELRTKAGRAAEHAAGPGGPGVPGHGPALSPGSAMTAPPLSTPDPGRPSGDGAADGADDGAAADRTPVRWWRRRDVRAWVPLIAVLLVLAVAMVLIVTAHWRRGSAALGAASLLAGVFRAVLPTGRVGLLAVRGRVFDVCFCAVSGGLLVLLAAVTE